MPNLKKQFQSLKMSRSAYKLPFLSKEILWNSVKRKKKKNITLYQRNTRIPFCFILKKLNIHQGKRFKSYNYSKIQLGLCLGELTLTRRHARHKAKIQVKIKKRIKNKGKVHVFNLIKKGFFG